jgi:hypothetical protein
MVHPTAATRGVLPPGGNNIFCREKIYAAISHPRAYVSIFKKASFRQNCELLFLLLKHQSNKLSYSHKVVLVIMKPSMKLGN